jgi:hypothetical protein
MEITNEDKIALLKHLGYKYGDVRRTLWSNGQKSGAITTEEFNPLDIVMLTKVLDIIEKGNYTTIESILTTKKCHIQSRKTGNVIAHGMGKTREEAILKAILEYIKQQK